MNILTKRIDLLERKSSTSELTLCFTVCSEELGPDGAMISAPEFTTITGPKGGTFYREGGETAEEFKLRAGIIGEADIVIGGSASEVK